MMSGVLRNVPPNTTKNIKLNETTLLHCSRITKLPAVAQPQVVAVLELAFEQQPSRHAGSR